MTTKTVYVIRTYQSVASLRRQIRDPDKPTVTLSEVVGAGTSGPVENAPPGDESTVAGEDFHFLGVDVSTPPTVRVFKTRSMHRMVK